VIGGGLFLLLTSLAVFMTYRANMIATVNRYGQETAIHSVNPWWMVCSFGSLVALGAWWLYCLVWGMEKDAAS
jgi:hypothetical protein